MFAYVTVGADDLDRAKRFNFAFLPTLGYNLTEDARGFGGPFGKARYVAWDGRGLVLDPVLFLHKTAGSTRLARPIKATHLHARGHRRASARKR